MSTSEDELDSLEDAAWLKEQRKVVVDYMNSQPVKHGGVAEEADWHLSPYLSIWRVYSGVKKGVTGWWSVCGDCPTDYLSGNDATNAREALRAFGKLWKEAALLMLKGKEHPTFKITYCTSKNKKELGDLLLRRSKLLLEFAGDDGIWEDE